MIRRFYIMPLNHGVDDTKVAEFVKGFDDTDRFLPGLIDSAAAIDWDSRTVVWENTFVDEASYTGPYMFHPYHAQVLDNYLMGDSPECITHDIYATRYSFDAPPPRIDKGVRRIVLLKLAENADASALEALAGRDAGMVRSVLGQDNVGWVSFKGRPWTHIWEQGFADRDALDRYLRTRDGMSCASKEALVRLGLDVEKFQVFTYDFALKPDAAPAPTWDDSVPVFLTLTAKVTTADADSFVAALERDYDPFMTDQAAPLVHRWRTLDHTGDFAEIQSSWQLASIAAYNAMRFATHPDARWTRFVVEAMPLVVGGTRRFYRAA